MRILKAVDSSSFLGDSVGQTSCFDATTDALFFI